MKTSTSMKAPGFERQSVVIPIASITALKILQPSIKGSVKYKQIVASIRAAGLVELPVVARDAGHRDRFFLLDGLMRIEALRELGVHTVECLVSTDDEAYTYNKRISRLSAVQEHCMIVRAVERGVSEERIAEALNLDVDTIRRRFRLLDGVCDEVAGLLADKPCPMVVFTLLKSMSPLRQVEAAELMVGQGNYSSGFARAIYAATPDDQRVGKRARLTPDDVSHEQIARLEKELASVQNRAKCVEESYGLDNLHLTVAKTYLAALLAKPKIVHWLESHHADYLVEFRAIAEIGNLSEAALRERARGTSKEL
jgi:hypothetical protein